MSKFFAGLDIGTTKIACGIAQRDEQGNLRLIGVGTLDSQGVRRSRIANLNLVKPPLQAVIANAMRMSRKRIGELMVGIGGEHIEMIVAQGITTTDTGKFSYSHKIDAIESAIEHVRGAAEYKGRTVIHWEPLYFVVDEERQVDDPVGMTGRYLQAFTAVITGQKGEVEDIKTLLSELEFEITPKRFVAQPIAAGYGVLDPGEKEIGVTVIDIGGGTTSVATYRKGGILDHIFTIPLGGTDITNDIANGLGVPRDQAEDLKTTKGLAYAESLELDSDIETVDTGGKSKFIKQSDLAYIIQARLEEILEKVYHELSQRIAIDTLAGGIVLTGGTANLVGIDDLAKKVFKIQSVRIGMPKISGLTQYIDPKYAVMVGLLKLWDELDKSHKFDEERKTGLHSFGAKLKRWLESLFR